MVRDDEMNRCSKDDEDEMRREEICTAQKTPQSFASVQEKERRGNRIIDSWELERGFHISTQKLALSLHSALVTFSRLNSLSHLRYKLTKGQGQPAVLGTR